MLKSLLLILFAFFSLFISFSIPKALAEGTYAGIGTADGTDGGADAINFSQGRVWNIDKFGKYIWVTEDRSNVHHFAYSNDLGVTWTQDSDATNATTRGSVAYDSINDKLHVIWTTDSCDAGGGIIYRRYGITRDGSNNITDIAREDSSNINLQLDITGSDTCVQPAAFWVNDGSANGTLVAVWTKLASGLNEVRASMRKLSLSAADGVAGNWAAPDGTGDTFPTDAPAVAADRVYHPSSGSNSASVAVRGGTGTRKDDLYIFVASSVSGNDNILAYRAIWSSGSGNWSGGWQSPVTVGAMSSLAGGYNLKYQLITRPILDTANDRLYVGWPRWKDNTNGDTFSMAYLNSTDTPSSTIDLYSALGTHSYAPTGDIMYDATQGLIYGAYVESTTNGDNGSIDYKSYDGTTLSGSTRFYTSPGGSAGADGSADIPILYDNRSNGRMLVAFRINGSLPPTSGDKHTLDFGYISLPTPTPTPSPSPSSSSSSSNNNSSSSTSSPSGPPACTSSTPSFKPNLFQIDTSATEAKLHFTTAQKDVSGYLIAFGTNVNADMYGDNFDYSGKAWIIDRVVSNLQPNTTYYFKIRVKNGCNAGAWGNIVKATTKNRSFLGSLLAAINPLSQKQPQKLSLDTQPTSCNYTVLSGDSLWDIAQNLLGTGSRYKEIMNLNQDLFKNGGTLIKNAWNLKVC